MCKNFGSLCGHVNFPKLVQLDRPQTSQTRTKKQTHTACGSHTLVRYILICPPCAVTPRCVVHVACSRHQRNRHNWGQLPMSVACMLVEIFCRRARSQAGPLGIVHGFLRHGKVRHFETSTPVRTRFVYFYFIDADWAIVLRSSSCSWCLCCCCNCCCISLGVGGACVCVSACIPSNCRRSGCNRVLLSCRRPLEVLTVDRERATLSDVSLFTNAVGLVVR